MGEVDEVVGPLADDLGVPDRAGGAAEHTEAAVAHLVAVAVVSTHAPRLTPHGPDPYERCRLWETGVR